MKIDLLNKLFDETTPHEVSHIFLKQTLNDLNRNNVIVGNAFLDYSS